MTISELKSKKSETIKETRAIVKQAQAENRDMTKEEQEMFDNNLIEIENLKAQISQLQDKLLEVATETKAEEPKAEEPKEEPKEEETVEEPKEETPNEDTTEEAQEEEEKSEKTDNKEEEKTDNSTEETPEEETENEDSEKEEINNKIKRNHINMNTFITKEIRSALEDGTKKFNLNAERRAVTVTGSNGVHDSAILEHVPGLLEPLYADQSIVKQLGIRTFSSLPLGDVRLPILSAQTAGWTGEITAATASNPGMTSVLCQPKRLTSYLDVSFELIQQDEIGVNDALRRDIYNSLINKLLETMFGDAAGSTTRPQGLFYNVQNNAITSYEDLCLAEAKVQDSNVGSNIKYLTSNTARAYLRSMAKSALTNQLVLTGDNIDGTPLVHTSLVKDSWYAVGDWSNVVLCQFGDIIVTVDEVSQMVNGCVRLVINSYWDFKRVRTDEDVLVFGTVSTPSTIDSSI